MRSDETSAGDSETVHRLEEIATMEAPGSRARLVWTRVDAGGRTRGGAIPKRADECTQRTHFLYGDPK